MKESSGVGLRERKRAQTAEAIHVAAEMPAAPDHKPAPKAAGGGTP